MLTVDSHFEIGTMHQVCEDYALHGEWNSNTLGRVVWGIVCDGCSGSQNTDIGARILAHRANAQINSIVDRWPEALTEELCPLPLTIAHLMQDRYHDAESSDVIGDIVKSIGLKRECLDSTLWIVIGIDKGDGKPQYKVIGWGDGEIVIKQKNSAHPMGIVCFDFPSGAPYYFSYRDDPSRAKQYATQFGTEFRQDIIIYNKSGETNIVSRPMEYDKPVYITYSYDQLSPIESISVFTDGVKTYNCNNDDPCYGSLEWGSRRLIDLQSTEGVFLQRRMKALSRRDAKNGIKHHDDLGGAMILNLEETVDESR